jgi:1,4-dihydroxy-2-naphthoyl-CoA hydrolase
MSIWQTAFTLETLMQRGQNTLSEHLGIEFVEVGADFLKAKMPVDHRTKQPIGIMHGGASCVLAETVGSVAANYCVDLTRFYCVGLDINTNHLRQAKEGFVVGAARPIHIGKRTHVWGIEIHHESGYLVSINRLTMMVLER